MPTAGTAWAAARAAWLWTMPCSQGGGVLPARMRFSICRRYATPDRTASARRHRPQRLAAVPSLCAGREQREQLANRLRVLVHLDRLPKQRGVVHRDLDRPLAQV